MADPYANPACGPAKPGVGVGGARGGEGGGQTRGRAVDTGGWSMRGPLRARELSADLKAIRGPTYRQPAAAAGADGKGARRPARCGYMLAARRGRAGRRKEG